MKWCKWWKCKWCRLFKWRYYVNVNDVNDADMTKLINDKTDLVTLLSLQNWPQTSLIPKPICPQTTNA